MSKPVLILGDILAIGIITLIGFATHGETDLSFLPRMAATFLPLTMAWLLLAPWLGLFQDEVVYDARQLWRPALTAFFSASLAAVLRGLVLSTAIIPIFAIVLGASSALGMAVWRALYFLLNRKAYEAR